MVVITATPVQWALAGLIVIIMIIAWLIIVFYAIPKFLAKQQKRLKERRRRRLRRIPGPGDSIPRIDLEAFLGQDSNKENKKKE